MIDTTILDSVKSINKQVLKSKYITEQEYELLSEKFKDAYVKLTEYYYTARNIIDKI